MSNSAQTASNERGQPQRQGRANRYLNRRLRSAIALSILTALLLGTAAWGYYFYYRGQFGPAQPIAFSHRLHATTKQLSCVFCHAGATRTARSGVPPLETCMLCHQRIIIEHPEIRKLREYYDAGQAVEWVKVGNLPEYAYFTHQMHTRAGVDCGHCHGDVKAMDRVKLAQDFKMGFCIQCHRDYKATTDCLACHR
jgi:hypothetical protein